jgi:methylmalonyl-CoA mutase
MDTSKLFNEFPPVSGDQWKEKITKDLKGADYERKLVWRTGERFDLQPLYRQEALEHLDNLKVCPGDFPFLRGKQVKGNHWLVRQDINVKDIADANAKALDIRMKGVDSLGFVFDGDYKPSMEDIELLLQNIRADLMELNYDSSYPLEIVNIMDSLAKKYNRELDKVSGSVNFDPIGYRSLKGSFKNGKEKDFALLEQLLTSSKHLLKFHVLTIDVSGFQNSGSGIVSQLAFALAKAADYLNYLTEKGFEIDEVAPKIRFNFGVGSSYFMEIAKFRAARYLWANIVNAYGLNDADHASMFIHCENTHWNKTVYDPYVNMLRTTTETLSALIAGVDSMTVLPFDAVYAEPEEFSERIARNQQLLLKGESYIDKVNDPAAGSYYIEELTQQIITGAWELFLEVDEMGGYLEAFRKGFIQQRIAKEASAKNNAIARRKRILLGTNQYPNITEHIDDLNEQVIHPSADADDEVLKPYRGAMGFEQLRYKTDQFSLVNPRPTVWMFTYGNLAMRNARAQFAGNFFGCAGFEIINNPGFENADAGINAALDANPDIVVICSSDDEYAENALKIFDALSDNTIVVLAGYPADLLDQLKDAGFTNFIHVRSNVLEELTEYQEQLGIA